MEGSGKSVAMKQFFTEYKKGKEGEFAIGFFFNKLGSGLERSFEGLLRVVLAKMLRCYPALFTCLRKHYKDNLDFIPRPHDRETMHTDWTRGSLEQAMELILNNTQYEAHFVLFVDAINECEDIDGTELIQIFRGYSDSRSGINFKICFSSTTDIALEGKYARQVPGLIMQDKTADDLSLYVRSCVLGEDSSSHFDANDLNQILKSVLDKAEGCWLWVEYAVSIVNKKSSTLGTVKRGLEDLPKTMEALYEVFLANLDEEHATEANDMLGVVLALGAACNGMSIYLDDFRYVLGFSSGQRCESQSSLEAHDDFMKHNSIIRSRIQEHFGRMLIVQDIDDDDDDDIVNDEADTTGLNKNGSVRLYHSTVKNFLSRRETASQSPILSGPDLERRGLEILTKACLRFWRCREIGRLINDLDNHGPNYFPRIEESSDLYRRLPLLPFTLDCFVAISCHAVQRNTENAEELKAFWTPQYFDNWKTITNTLLRRKLILPEFTLTAECVGADCDAIIRHQIECHGVNANEVIPDFGTYLCLASLMGSTKIVTLLLSFEYVDIDYCSFLGTPLSIAAARGHKEIVKILLDHGANPDICSVLGDDPLSAAASSLNFDIVRLLWEHPGSSVCFKNSKHRTSRALLRIGSAIRYAYVVDDVDLSTSELNNATDVIQILALNGLDMAIFSHTSIPWFLWSLCVGSTEVMRLFMDSPDFILSRASGGQSLIHIVCCAGNLNMIELIARRFEDLKRSIDETDGRQCTILHYGSLNLSHKVVEYLLDREDLYLDVNAQDIFGLTPLHSAFARGTAKSVRSLALAGANMNDEGPEGLRMPHFAASNLLEPKIIDLLPANTELNILDRWDRSPLHIACQFGEESTVEWLLEKGLNPSAVDDRGRTALHCACQNQAPSSVRIIKLLLKHGASPTAIDYGGSTPLHLAFHDPEKMAKDLFWDDFTKSYWDVFSEVECARKAKCMLEIDGKNEFTSIRDNEGNTSLHLACWRGLGSVIAELMLTSTAFDIKDERGFLPYQLIENDDLSQLVETWASYVLCTQSYAVRG